MPYSIAGWTLYRREVKLKDGPTVSIYLFSRRKPGPVPDPARPRVLWLPRRNKNVGLAAPCELPAEKAVAIAATGIPFVVDRESPGASNISSEGVVTLGDWRLYRSRSIDGRTGRPVVSYWFSKELLSRRDGLECEPVKMLPPGVQVMFGENGLPAIQGLRPEHLTRDPESEP